MRFVEGLKSSIANGIGVPAVFTFEEACRQAKLQHILKKYFKSALSSRQVVSKINSSKVKEETS